MPAMITVNVEVHAPAGMATAQIVVHHATPVGAAWSHLPDGIVRGDPPWGVHYILNGTRTLPSAWMADGDLLVIDLSEAR